MVRVLSICAFVLSTSPFGALALDEPVESGGGLSLRLFRPAVDSKGMVTVNASSILGHLDPSFGLVLDAGLGMLPVRGDADLVDGLYTGTLSANLGLFNAAVVGLEAPVAIGRGAFDGTVPGLRSTGDNRTLVDLQEVGDVVLHGKLRLVRIEQSPVGIAAVLQLGLPTGSPRSFVGEPGGSLAGMLVVDVAPVRRLRVALNLGARSPFGAGSTIGAGEQRVEYGPEITAGAGVSWGLWPGTLDVVAESYGSTTVARPFAAATTPVEAVGGLKVFVERRSYLYLGGGAGLTEGFSAADQRFFLAFVFEPSIGDRDGDGLADDVDRCPDEPEDHDQFEDEDGCPEPDNDRDGILDVDDECPLVPEDRDGEDDSDGCPESGRTDRDGDRILDDVDQCPDEPEDVDRFEDADGCPDPDNDRDGILDTDDLCPDDAEDADRFDDLDGCPDPDNDADRILDVDDDCPVDPETYNGTDDADGCPDTGIVDWRGNDLVPLEEIHFQTDSAVIQPQSFRILDALAAALAGNVQVHLVEIQGHADERAEDDYNIQLTRDRAAAVLEALVRRGIDRRRLRSAGYGERCPIDPRHDERAWRRNRRVAFKILETDRGPTGVEVACPAGRELVPER